MFFRDEYTILWILLGEKRVLGGNLSHRNYEGHLVINGAYVLDHNHIVGRFNGEFVISRNGPITAGMQFVPAHPNPYGLRISANR